MSWRTNPLMLTARNVGRALGVNRFLASWTQKGYEENYDAMLSAQIRPGDIVWDIGANVGYYTAQFSEGVGPNGRVIAFEPSPANFPRLEAAIASLDNVTLQPCGLGNIDGELHFQQGADSLGATSRVVEDADGGELVQIKVGDNLIDAGMVSPNIIKLDVEGFEGEVLEGLVHCLRSPALRALGIEVHFGILRERGLGRMPQRIEADLRAAGFKVAWPDSSHILATRPA